MSNTTHRPRPFFLDRDGETRHWNRYDRLYRSPNGRWLFTVVDSTADAVSVPDLSYLVLRQDASNPLAAPVLETAIPWDGRPHAFAVACQMAERLAAQAERAVTV